MIWVLDKSAHVRLAAGAAAPNGIDYADFAVCEMGELEWLYSAESSADYDRHSQNLRATFPIFAAPIDIFERVRRLQSDLAHHHGMWHRTAIPDLFIAETALHHGAGVLHHDRDYARIAAVRPALRQCNLAS
jgi:predicted nucleic acid-binding protein